MSDHSEYQRNVVLLLLKGIMPTAIVTFGLLCVKSGWFALLGYHAWILIALICRLLRKSPQASKTIGRASRVLLLTILLCVFPLVVGVALSIFVSILPTAGLIASMESIGIGKSAILPYALYLCVANGLLEETYWRILGPNIDKNITWLNDFLYALFHLPVLLCFFPPIAVPISIVGLLGAGAIWRITNRVFGSFWVSAISHLLCNLAIWIWLYVRLY